MLQVRRIVTGHDANGRAVVKMDEMAKNVTVGRPGQSQAVLWTTEGFPVNNDGDEDGGLRQVGTTHAGGTVLRLVEFEPGVAGRVHRTDSIDYGIIISGQLDMELDDGVVVHLNAGDVVVQRGTIHNWANNGTVPCVVAFVLIDGKAVEVGGKTLSATG